MILTMASSNTEQIPINKLIVLGSQVVHEILYFDWNSNVNLSTKGDSNFVFLLSSLKTNFHDKCSCKWWRRMTKGGGRVRQMLTIAVWEPLNLADILCAPCICKLWDIFSFCWHSLPPLGRMWHISHLTPFLSPSTPPSLPSHLLWQLCAIKSLLFPPPAKHPADLHFWEEENSNSNAESVQTANPRI